MQKPPAPAAYADDYEELKKAFELAHRSEESTKLIKEIDKALDEKAVKDMHHLPMMRSWNCLSTRSGTMP